MTTPVVHIAGPAVRVGDQLRQRCSWCGAVLIDVDLTCLAVPEGQEAGPPTWPFEELVAVDGAASYVVPHDHDNHAPLPEGACGRLDPAVTA